MPNTPALGSDCRLYRLSTGSRATWGAATAGLNTGPAPASLDEISYIGDLEVPDEADDIDVTTRAGRGFKQHFAGLRDSSIDVMIVYDRTDTDVIALEAAYQAKSLVGIAALDGDKATVGVKGLWADFIVTAIKKSEPIADKQTITFTLKLGLSAVPPERVKVAAE